MSDNAQDPVLNEVRRARQQVFEERGGTLRSFFKRLHEEDAKAGDALDLSQPPRRPGDDQTGATESAA